MHGKFITQIYADNCDVVDYLYEENPYDWVNRLDNYFAQTLGQPKITAQAANYLLPLGNMRTAEGKIELEDLLASEGITHKDINALLKTSQYADVDPLYFVINKKSITDLLTNFGNFDEQSAQDIYSRFHQTLNVIYDESDPNQVKSFNEFFSLVDAFGLKNDKDFYNFEQQVEQTYLKQGKNKKQQVNKKPKAENIKEFISLCSYLTDDMILKYQKDKYYPLKSELLKRKAQFEKVKPEFEKQIAALNVQHIFQSPYEVFVEYEKLARLYPDVRVFVQKLVDRKNEENDSKTQVAQTRNEFLKHFKDKEKLELFLAKNSFTIDDSKESQTYSKIYLRILNALFEGKDEKKANEYLEKLMMNNFLPNIKPGILKFADKKTDFELGTLFEIILDEGYENPSDVYSFINKYRNKNGDISSFLQNFKKYDIDFETYLKRIENVQKEFINAGIPITIDNDNVSKIDLNEYSEGKITDFKLAQLAKNILTPQGEGNFISGLKLAFIPVKVSIGEKAIGKEILASQNGRYSEELSNIIRVFNLQMEKINPSNTPEASIDWEKLIDDDFAKFINSSSWLDFQENGKLPNLTLHAKMRLIDRFVLDSDDKTAKDLYSQETKEELKNVLKTVYTTTPIKLYKSQDENHDDRFVAFFNYGSNEIKAVFNKNGQMLTIIKR